MELAEIPESDRAQHLDLLLIADESADMIERYLHRGDLLALIEDDEARALCVVTQEEPDVFEIKNIVTVPEHQRKGYGRQLVALVAERYRGRGDWLLVGTGDVPGILRDREAPATSGAGSSARTSWRISSSTTTTIPCTRTATSS